MIAASAKRYSHSLLLAANFSDDFLDARGEVFQTSLVFPLIAGPQETRPEEKCVKIQISCCGFNSDSGDVCAHFAQ
jgi:hypothetical protein